MGRSRRDKAAVEGSDGSIGSAGGGRGSGEYSKGWMRARTVGKGETLTGFQVLLDKCVCVHGIG